MTQQLTPQQSQLREGGNFLEKYLTLTVGPQNWHLLLGFELYELILSNLGGLLGYGTRSIALKFLLKKFGSNSVTGKAFRYRLGSKISIGKSCVIDDHVFFDARVRNEIEPEINIGNNCFIGRGSIIAARGASLSFADGVNVSSYCRIATENKIEIGEGTLIAAYSYIGPGNHVVDHTGKLNIAEGMVDKGGVKIGKNVWVGTKATILDGVTIGDNAIIGAHSLVREDVPAGATVAGVPAKTIKA